MTRGSVLGVILSAGVMSVAVGAYQQGAAPGQPPARVLEVEKLKDNLFVAPD
jgi:hypothetical protein